MTRLFFAPIRLQLNCLNLDGFERRFRRSFSLSSGLYAVRPWTAEESRKLLGLYQKGLLTSEIAKQFDHRSLLSVKNHVVSLRRGSMELSSRKTWTAEENTILKAKRQAGCAFKDIHIPGRSIRAMQERWKYLLNGYGGRKPASPVRASDGKYTKRYSDAQVERIIKLRVEDHKSFKEIAIEMGASNVAIGKLWLKRCKPLVPEQVLQELRSSTAWTREHDDLLIARYNAGEKLDDIRAHFPNRTKYAIKGRLYALWNSLVARHPKTSPARLESLKQDLEPYIGARLTGAKLQRIRERHQPMSDSAIRATLYRMRRGKVGPLRLPVDEMEAEGRIASRRPRGR